MSDSHANWLRRVADEIAKAGHYGWGNTCEDAAEHIDALEAELAALRERAGRARVVAAGYKADAERWRTVSAMLTHEHRGDAVGWTLSLVLPGDDPDAAIDAARGET